MKRLFSKRESCDPLVQQLHNLFTSAKNVLKPDTHLSHPTAINTAERLILLFCQAESVAVMNLLTVQDKKLLKDLMKDTILHLPQHVGYTYFHLYFSGSKEVDHPFLGDLISFRREVDHAWYASRNGINLTASLIHRHCEWDQMQKKGESPRPMT